MKAQRSLSGLLVALGVDNLRESPDISLAFAYPVPHLVRHDFPHGCGQLSGRISSPAVVGQHSFCKWTAGAGGLHVHTLGPATAIAAQFIIVSRPPESPLAEVGTAPVARSELPLGNGYSSAQFRGSITIATLAGVSVDSRFVVDVASTLPFWEFKDSWRIPRGHHLYAIHLTSNTLLDLSWMAWESCPD